MGESVDSICSPRNDAHFSILEPAHKLLGHTRPIRRGCTGSDYGDPAMHFFESTDVATQPQCRWRGPTQIVELCRPGVVFDCNERVLVAVR